MTAKTLASRVAGSVIVLVRSNEIGKAIVLADSFAPMRKRLIVANTRGEALALADAIRDLAVEL